MVLKGVSGTSAMRRMRSSSSFVRMGCDTSSHLRFEVPFKSRMFGRGPIKETRLMTSSSRIGSMGGFVTWAKFCLK